MPSQIAQTIVDDLRVKGGLNRKIAMNTIDIAMLKVTAAFGHARHRDHLHNPAGCHLCRNLDEVVKSLGVKLDSVQS